MIIKEGLTQREALDLEAALIRQWGRLTVDGGVLLNRKHGFAAGGACMGNQHAKGKRHKIKEQYNIKKRARCWWNDGEKNYHRSKCPPGCVEGRIGTDTWKRIDQKGAKNAHAQKWQLTYADGSVILVTALKAWCRDQPDLNYNSLYTAWQRHLPHKHIQEVIKL